MSSESVFEKKLTPETTMDKVEGLLEHFNLPPKVISFIRTHQKTIIAVISVIVIVVVSLSLYKSYRDNLLEKSSTALSVALQKQGAERRSSLIEVSTAYDATPSGLWAKVELAHLDMEEGQFPQAAEKYQAILENLNTESPLYSLILFGMGQAYEADKQYAEAETHYDQLKEIPGYKNIGYFGKARIEEAKGNNEKAIAIYNNFLLSVGEDNPQFEQFKTQVNARIARLKARQ